MGKLFQTLKERRRCLGWIQELGGVSATARKTRASPVRDPFGAVDMTGALF